LPVNNDPEIEGEEGKQKSEIAKQTSETFLETSK
jgi:hypothetical protein